MPRVNGIYTRPPGSDAIGNATASSAAYNAWVADVEVDLNAPRPVIAGGTGGGNADDALKNLSAEKSNQIVTDFNAHNWMPGSFSAAASALHNGPIANHAFTGIVYVADNPLPVPPAQAQNAVIEARDMDDGSPVGTLYTRQKKAGVWGPWISSSTGGSTAANFAGCGLLSIVGASSQTLKFSPYGGDQIKINGAIFTIPAAGITATVNSASLDGGAGTNLTTGVNYYVYLFNKITTPGTPGVLTIDFSVTTHATSATPGNIGTEIKSGDDSRTLIGFVRPSGGPVFYNDRSWRAVRSWFNRQAEQTDLGANWPSQVSVNQQAPGEIHVNIRVAYFAWRNEQVSLSFMSPILLDGLGLAGKIGYTAISVDGVVNPVGLIYPYSNIFSQMPVQWLHVSYSIAVNAVEGWHTASVMGWNELNSIMYFGLAGGGVFGCLMGSIKS